MNLFIYLFTYLLFVSNPQQKEVHVFFDSKSKKTYIFKEGNKNHELYFYRKIIHKSGIEFIIGDEHFFVEQPKNKAIVSEIDVGKLTTFQSLKEEIKKNKFKFKSEVYDNINIYEKINDNKYIKYNAKLMYFEN